MKQPVLTEAWCGKRAFDVVAASGLLVGLGPFALAGASCFAAETRLNPLFPQQRVGAAGSIFTAYKLRTMNFAGDYADRSNGDNDERASNVGGVLRASKLDEVPMLWNVLRRQLSMVGPRPLVESEVAETMELLSPPEQREWQWSREILPGMVSAFNGPSSGMDRKSDEFLLARVERDIWYRPHASAMVDLMILGEAMKAVVTQS